MHVFYYFPIMGLAIGLGLTTLMFALVMRVKIQFPGREGVVIWGSALFCIVTAQSIIAITRAQPLYVRDVALFALVYFSIHGFGLGFLALHGVTRPRHIVRAGVILTAAYAALLLFDDHFWVRATALNLMQAGVLAHVLMSVVRVYFVSERARLSATLSILCCVIGIAGCLLRAQGAIEQQDAFMRLTGNTPLDGIRQFILTLLATLLGALGLLQGCFERVVEVTRHAENFNPLTDLLNPAPLKASGEREIALAYEQRHGLAVALVRIDDFKKIRLLQGEEVAGTAMQAIAQALVPDRRLVELAGHIYEDILCLIAPSEEAPAALGELCLRRMHARIATGNLQFSVSVGVAALPLKDTAFGWNELLRHAERALEAAGAAGGNRCVLYSPHLAPAPTPQPLQTA